MESFYRFGWVRNVSVLGVQGGLGVRVDIKY